MKGSDVFKKISQTIFEGAQFFQAEKIEIVGTYLDMRIIGCDRKNIKITTSGQTYRRSMFSSAEIYYRLQYLVESGKLIIKNKCNLAISPINRCKVTVELPRGMPITIFSEGLAHIEISDMETLVTLDLSSTYVNYYRCKELSAKISKMSKILINNAKAENMKLDISDTSGVYIHDTVEIKNLDVSMLNKSEMESFGRIGEASVYITGGGKLNIEKISKSPVIITDEKYKNDIRIFQVG